MAGRKRQRMVREAREAAMAEGRDPDQAERDMRQELGMVPKDAEDKRQREAKGMPEHPSLEDFRGEPVRAPRANGKSNGSKPEPEPELDDDVAASLNLGQDGKPMTALDLVKRDAAIIQLIKKGIGTATAGAQFGLSQRQTQRVVKKYEDEAPDLEELDPGSLVRQTLWNYEAAIEELALLAAKTPHGPTKVGAIRVRLEALRGRLELLQSVGAVPHDLGQIRVMDDQQHVARQIIGVFEAYDIPEDVRFAIVDVIEGRQPALPSGEAEAEDAVLVEDEGESDPDPGF